MMCESRPSSVIAPCCGTTGYVGAAAAAPVGRSIASIETKLSVEPDEWVPSTTIFSTCGPLVSPVLENSTAWFWLPEQSTVACLTPSMNTSASPWLFVLEPIQRTAVPVNGTVTESPVWLENDSVFS